MVHRPPYLVIAGHAVNGTYRFEQYEALGDIQMLAMLSCVLQEPEDSNAVQDTPKAMFKPASSPRYFPTAEIARSILGLDAPKASSRKASASRAVHDTHGFDTAGGLLPPRARRPKWRLKNQERFGGFMGDGYADKPLLDKIDSTRYVGWRDTYARQLRAWGLHKQAIEVLKYNEALRAPPQHTAFGKASKSDLAPTTTQGQGLKIKRAEDLETLTCGYCGQVIENELSAPCGMCGHVTHIHCWKEWKVTCDCKTGA